MTKLPLHVQVEAYCVVCMRQTMHVKIIGDHVCRCRICSNEWEEPEADTQDEEQQDKKKGEEPCSPSSV